MNGPTFLQSLADDTRAGRPTPVRRCAVLGLGLGLPSLWTLGLSPLGLSPVWPPNLRAAPEDPTPAYADRPDELLLHQGWILQSRDRAPAMD